MTNKAKRQPKEIVISENRAFEGIWIPKRLYITNKFNPRTKFFIVELKSLSKKGYCYATDKHFADFLGVSTRVVQTMIKSLKDDGYLETEYEYEKGTQAIKRRFLILTKKFLDEFYNETEPKRSEEKFDTPYEQNFNEPIEEKFERGIEENCGEKYNNKTKNNSNSSNTDSSETDKYALEDVKRPSSKGNIYASVPEEQEAAAPKKQSRYIPKDYTEEQLWEHIKPVVENEVNQYIDDFGVNFPDDRAKTFSDILCLFCCQYKEHFRENHYVMPDKTLKSAVRRYLEPPEEMDGIFDVESYEELIDLYFKTDFNKRGNYDGEIVLSFPHFMSDTIRGNLANRLWK